MTEPRKQHIILQLSAHSIALQVQSDQEQAYREAAVLLNKRYVFYQQRMPQATVEQLWVYVALEMAVNLCSDARDKSLQPVEKRLKAMNELIRRALAQTDTAENKEGGLTPPEKQ
ncbi:MAG: cell division protein ZapA [Paludibacteraceae bacterium]